jgi:hypothetical protein
MDWRHMGEVLEAGAANQKTVDDDEAYPDLPPEPS